MSWRLEESNQSASSIPSNGYRGYTQQDSMHKSSQSARGLAIILGCTVGTVDFSVVCRTFMPLQIMWKGCSM